MTEPLVLHHLSLAVTDLDRSAAFYDAALGALGFVRSWSFPDAVGYGVPGGGDRFAIKRRGGGVGPADDGFHVAFAAGDHRAVDAFHAAAVAAGGRDNGPPGPRPAYGPAYYAAFVLDPDGHPLEAVVNG